MKLDRYTIVHRFDEGGIVVESRLFGPGDELPDWAAEQVTEGKEAGTADEPALAPAPETYVSEITKVINEQPFLVPEDEPEDDDEPEDEVPDEETEPADEDDEREFVGEAPPKGGPGSSADAWAKYASDNGVEVVDGMERGDIIAACEAAGVPTD